LPYTYQHFNEMNIEIITKERQFHLYGFSGTAINKDYAGTAFKLMDRMWKIVKSKALPNKGMNIWVYETNDRVFPGVELTGASSDTGELEQKTVVLSKYAYYKHVGPYQLIKTVGMEMTGQLKSKGFETTLPYVEIYGHWTNDETKLETELLMSLK